MIHTLDRVKVEGYKSIRSLDLAVQPINVLVGPNGAGKTNFLEVFDLVGEMIRGNLRATVSRLGGPERLLHGGLKQTGAIRVRLEFGRNGYEALLAPSRSAGLYFEREQCWGQGYLHEEPYVVPLGVGHSESMLPEEAQDPAHKVAQITLETMQSWTRFHFHDTSESAPPRQPQPINDNRELRRDAANLAPFLRRLRSAEPASYGRIVDAVRQVAPFFHDFVLEPDTLNEHLIRLEWRPADGDYYGDPHALSDGTLRFMCLAALLLQPEPPSLVLIDEPELGLHPSAIVHLADLVRAVPDERRIILSTQSVTLLNQFDVADIIVVDRRDGASTFARLDDAGLAAWLDEYAIGELWEKNLIGGRPARA
jgi:predicted ATPase